MTTDTAWLRLSEGLLRRWSGGIEIGVEQSIELHGRQRVAILGPSGCGKTTMLRLLGTLLRPTEGEISYDLPGHNQVVWQATGGARATESLRGRFAFVCQDARLLPHLTVLENVLAVSLARGLSAETLGERAAEALNRMGELGLGDPQIDPMDQADPLPSLRAVRAFAHRSGSRLATLYPTQLSGGQRRRVALLRALTAHPRVLFADEPTSSVDVKTAEMVKRALKEWVQDPEEERLLVFVTHKPDEALALGDRWLGFGDETTGRYRLRELDAGAVEGRVRNKADQMTRLLEG